MESKIIYADEHQHMKNSHVCDFCDDPEQHVVGASYTMGRDMRKQYLFHYCERCGRQVAQSIINVCDRP
jgi:hypothetical protein